jgi:hypothetical protein
MFLKLFHGVYAPSNAAAVVMRTEIPYASHAVEPLPHHAVLPDDHCCALGQLHAGVDHALDLLLDHVGFRLAP